MSYGHLVSMRLVVGADIETGERAVGDEKRDPHHLVSRDRLLQQKLSAQILVHRPC